MKPSAVLTVLSALIATASSTYAAEVKAGQQQTRLAVVLNQTKAASITTPNRHSRTVYFLDEGPFAGMSVISESETERGNSLVTLADQNGRKVSLLLRFPGESDGRGERVSAVKFGQWKIMRADLGSPSGMFSGRVTGYFPSKSAPKCMKIEKALY